MGGGAGRWRRLTEKLSAPAAEAEREDLREVADRLGGTPIRDVRDRELADVCGTVRSVTVRPKSEHVPALVVDLDDGSRTLRLVWLGRRQIAGVRTGAYLTAHGRVCMRSGTPTIYNPSYELRSGT